MKRRASSSSSDLVAPRRNGHRPAASTRHARAASDASLTSPPPAVLPLRSGSHDPGRQPDVDLLDTDAFSQVTDPGGYRVATNLAPVTLSGRTRTRTEDALTAFSAGGGEFYTFAVADGHGGSYKYSQLVTALCVSLLPDLLKEHRPVSEALREFCAEAHRITQERLRTDPGGTTFTVVVLQMSTYVATVAHLGDSPAYLFDADGLPVHMTTDHDAASASEQARIRAIFPRADFFFDDGVVRFGPTRIMPTRGFGDNGANRPVGVIGREPEIAEMQLQPGGAIVVASDGLVECPSRFANRVRLTGNRSIRDAEIAQTVAMHVARGGRGENLATELLRDLHANNRRRYIELGIRAVTATRHAALGDNQAILCFVIPDNTFM